MPRASSITLDLVVEVAWRRDAGEPWKCILADLRARGLPSGRTHWHEVLRDVRERRDDCEPRAA